MRKRWRVTHVEDQCDAFLVFGSPSTKGRLLRFVKCHAFFAKRDGHAVGASEGVSAGKRTFVPIIHQSELDARRGKAHELVIRRRQWGRNRHGRRGEPAA